MKLYFKYLKIQLKTNTSYRASFWFTMIGQVLSSVGIILGFALLFDKFKILGDYSIYDILITYSVVLLVFAFDEMVFRGFDEFDGLIKSGDLDRLLLRPRNIVLQICGYKVELMKLGRVILATVVLIVGCVLLPTGWTFGKILILLEMIISGIITFFGVYLFTSSITIFTIQKAEFINIFTDGGRELCYYPLDIFPKLVTKIFTFVIPFASFNYLPLRYILGFADASVWNIIFPAFSIVFAVICYFVFNFCLKFYKSAG